MQRSPTGMNVLCLNLIFVDVLHVGDAFTSDQRQSINCVT